jgi:hypothetical protein
VGALWVALPERAVVVYKEAGSVADDECVFVVGDAVWAFKGDEPVVRLLESLVRVYCRGRARDFVVFNGRLLPV